MIVSSVYSWLKDLRSNCDLYDEKLNSEAKLKSVRRKCCCEHEQSQKHSMFDIPDMETVLLRNEYTRRSVPMKKRTDFSAVKPSKSGFAEKCMQERAKKAWSVGDAWGVDFQLKDLTTRQAVAADDADVIDDVVKEVLEEFAFLSDVEVESNASDGEVKQEAGTPEAIYENIKQKQDQPVYQNIATLSNPKLQQLLVASRNRESTLSNASLSSTYSFVSCGLSEADSQSQSQSSGTYTFKSSTCSGATFQTETETATESDTYSLCDYDIDDWEREEWRSLSSLGNSLKKPLKPLKKGKSLDSFNLTTLAMDTTTNEVQLRHKVPSGPSVDRRSVIPVFPASEMRNAILIPKALTPDQPSTYMNIWECYTNPTETTDEDDDHLKPKPTPAPRTKLLQPSLLPTPRSRTLNIKKARENIVSFAFDETVEYLQEDAEDPKRDVREDSERLPPLDVVMWMTRLMAEFDSEPEIQVPSGYEGNEFLSASSQDTQRDRKISYKQQEAQDMMLGHSPPAWESSHEFRDNKIFTNVRKYKIDDQQFVKFKQHDVIEVLEGKLVHKNSESCKVLASNVDDCRLERKTAKECIVILPDRRRIYLHYKNGKDSPESARATPSTRVAPVLPSGRMDWLKQFFLQRPKRDALTNRGILKNENVFGNTLLQLERKHGCAVPNLVLKCIEYVELPMNIITQGLYRSSASLAVLQELRFAINDTDGKDLSSLEKYRTNVDIPTGLLKLFIRELKDSLISREEFGEMREILEEDLEEHTSYYLNMRYEKVFEVVRAMSPAHRDTLEALMAHLLKVIAFRDKNDMSMEGIAICWGQTMITGSEASDPVLMARRKNEVVELLLKAYEAKASEETKEMAYDTPSPVKMSAVLPTVKPSRIPQRQPSVESHMKPPLADSPRSSVSSTSATAVAYGRHQSSANYVQPPLMSYPSMKRLHQMGSTMSLCNKMEATHRSRFIQDLIRRIELNSDCKGIYRGRGKRSLVEKLVRKYKKENSKEFHRIMARADVFVLADVLQEVIKEGKYVLDFYDMQTLVEKKCMGEIRYIIEEIPEYIVLLFRHFDHLKKHAISEADALTLSEDIFVLWWPILIGSPNDASERVGRNQATFEQLCHIVLELSTQHERMKSASLLDLRLLDQHVDKNDNDGDADSAERVITLRCVHHAPALCAVAGTANNLRRSFMYVTPGTMSEEFRSRIKFLTSKNHQLDAEAHAEQAVAAAPTPEPDVECESLVSSTLSVRSVRSAADTISLSAARHATAREFRGVLRDDNGDAKRATRVACPKPSAMSPYAKQDEEQATLKNHYAKVLLHPFKPFGVTFPPTVGAPTPTPAKKPRRFEQYLGTANQQPVMSANETVKPISSHQNRQLQSTSTSNSALPEADLELDHEPSSESNYDYAKKTNHNDNRYLEMSTAEHNPDTETATETKFIGDSKALRKRHVEVVKMEVIKLDKKLKRSKRTTNINSELEHVLQEALAQSKIYEQNVLGASEYEDYEEEQELKEHSCWPSNGYRSLASRFNPPRSSHTSVEMIPKASQPKVSFDAQTRNRGRERSEDGKHCYTMLKSVELESVEPKEPKSESADTSRTPRSSKVPSQRTTSEDSMALTDLNDYDDGSSKAVAQMVQSGYDFPAGTGPSPASGAKTCASNKAKTEGRKSNASDDSKRLAKMERDIKMAQRQHSQRVLDVFDIMQTVKK